MEESTTSPSKVLHLRNLPDGVTEREVMLLGVPFGKVVNVLLLKHKNQAFLEMAEPAAASGLVSYYNTVPATIRDRSVYVQFSKHQELKTTQGVASSVQSVLAPGIVGGISSPGGASPSSVALEGALPQQGCPNSVLRVIIENMLYPITIDILQQIFSKYGSVIRIVTFLKNSQFHALIQYSDSGSATSAKAALDSQNIYNGCCTLRIDFSKLSNLTVKFNNEKTRDFTRPDLPSGENEAVAAALPELSAAFGIPTTLLQSPALANLRTALLTLASGNSVQGASGGGLPGSVLLVSNLNEKMITPHVLFILFGVYGDVTRVKVLYNKRDSALIQFKEPHQSQTALSNLNGVMLYGKKMHVTHSRHAQVQMPQAGSNEDALTEDYTNSPLHRFKPGSKNYQNIFPPSATLHLSNIPDGIDEEYIRTLFVSTGGTVQNFRFFQNDRRMALIQMGSTEEAIAALIAMHNYKINESNHLRVSFSKNPIS
eukprot:Em0011g545a